MIRALVELCALYVLYPFLVLTGLADSGVRWFVWLGTGGYLLWLYLSMGLKPSDFGISSASKCHPGIVLILLASVAVLAGEVFGLIPTPAVDRISPKVVGTFYVWLSAPLQEAFFRGFFFYRYERLLGATGVTFASGALFGFYHVIFGLGPGFLLATAAGIVLAFLFRQTRNLCVCWACHAWLGVLAYFFGLASHFTMPVSISL